MSFGQYQFLSWARRGIARHISEQDTLGAGAGSANERAGISISVQVNETVLPDRVFALTGPGDITGIQSSMIIRTEPPLGIADYEPNLLPYIEFYDEDFPWRYSPASPAGDKEHLRPWLALIVLKEGEFEDTKRREPLTSIKITDPANLPPHDQLHLWAHMHSNLPHKQSEFESFIDDLEEDAKRDPDGVYSRILCPRKLEPNALYHAFLVPSYETGRLAGTGRPTVDVKAQQPAWPSADSEFPVYYRWYFRTGQNFDFEYLVKLLEPRIMDERVGLRPMDCSRPGFVQADKNEEVSAPVPSILLLEGAVKSPSAKSTVFPPAETPQPFFDEMKKLVNLNKYQLENLDSDPYVSTPYYGMYHAMRKDPDHPGKKEVPTFDPESGNWYNDLNRDPRTRVPAGFGVRVMQENQEKFMDKAWKQLEGVLDANKKMRLTKFSAVISQQLFNKTILNRPTEDILSLTFPLASRILTVNETLKFTIQKSVLPKAIFSAGFKKLTRSKTSLLKGLNVEDISGNFVSLTGKMNQVNGLSARSKSTFKGIEGLNAITFFEAPSSINQVKGYTIKSNLELDYLYTPPAKGGLKNIDIIKEVDKPVIFNPGVFKPIGNIGALKPVKLSKEIERERPLPDVKKPPLNLDIKVAPVLVQEIKVVNQPDVQKLNVEVNQAFNNVNSRFQYREPVNEDPVLQMASVKTYVTNTLNPSVSYKKLIAGQIKWPGGIIKPPKEDFLPAMAYPDIPEPAYKYLIDIDKEFLLPNLQLIPQNTLSLLKTNQKFIEAYLMGLNHEMGRELLWREYPTDMRGTYFRQFWDTANFVTPDTSPQNADKLKDIRPIHQWGNSGLLGSHNARDAQGDAEQLVFVIRGDLLKKFPNTVVYAQKAILIDGKKKIRVDLTSEQYAKEVRFPLYQAEIVPDIKLLGFDLTIDEAAGIDETPGFSDKDGWFFIMAEVPGEPRFGMDVTYNPNTPNGSQTWNDLSWENFGGQNLKFIRKEIVPGNTGKPGGSFNVSGEGNKGKWGTSSSDMAAILFQRPVMVATHATEMLDIPVPDNKVSNRFISLIEYIHSSIR